MSFVDFLSAHSDVVMLLTGATIPIVVSFVTTWLQNRFQRKHTLLTSSIDAGFKMYQHFVEVSRKNIENGLYQSVNLYPPDYWIIYSLLIFNDLDTLVKKSEADLKKHMDSIKSKSIIIANQYDTETIQ